MSTALCDSFDVEQLLIQAGSGDAGAFADLYQVAGHRTLALAFRLVRNMQLAEDANQDAWALIWQQASRFDPDKGSAASWILMTVHRRAVDKIRGEQRRRHRELRSATLDFGIQCGDETLDAIVERSQLPELRNALAALSAVQREAILTAYSDDHLNRDEAVADALGIPLGTAKYRIRQGLMELRRQMFDAAA